MALLYWGQNSPIKKGALAKLKTAPYKGPKQPKKGAKIGPLSMEMIKDLMMKKQPLKKDQNSQNWPSFNSAKTAPLKGGRLRVTISALFGGPNWLF